MFLPGLYKLFYDKKKQNNQTLFLLENCDPCDAPELLSRPVSSSNGGSTLGLQALGLSSLAPLPDPSCGFRPEETPYQDTLVPDEPLDLNQAFMASQISDIGMSMAGEVQSPPGREVANSMMEG